MLVVAMAMVLLRGQKPPFSHPNYDKPLHCAIDFLRHPEVTYILHLSRTLLRILLLLYLHTKNG
jgi:hypothetical protein